MSLSSVCTPYVEALIGSAADAGILDAVAADIDLLEKCVKEGNSWFKRLESPFFSRQQRVTLVNEIFAGRMREMTISFLQVIMHHGRQSVVSSIPSVFRTLIGKHNSVVPATVFSARTLDVSMRSRIQERLQKKLGVKLDMQYKIDAGILGGFRVVYGDRMLDMSTSGALEELRRQMMEQVSYNVSYQRQE